MPREFSRSERVADYLQRELAMLISKGIRDPRVGMVDVTAVKVNRDLSHARVYVTLMGQPEGVDVAERINVLNKAAGFLRSSLAKGHTMRTTPKLQFVYDESIARGHYLSGLIDKAVADDERKQHGRGEVGSESDDLAEGRGSDAAD